MLSGRTLTLGGHPVQTPEAGSYARSYIELNGRIIVMYSSPQQALTSRNVMAFDPSGPRIATVGREGLVEIRDVESGSRVAVLHGPPGGVTGVAFSPDGSRVAVPHTDGTVRLFEADTGAQQLVLPGFGCTVSRVAFSPEGSKLATTSPCGGVRIWDLDIADVLEIAHREVPRALTDEECRQYLHVDQCPQV